MGWYLSIGGYLQHDGLETSVSLRGGVLARSLCVVAVLVSAAFACHRGYCHAENWSAPKYCLCCMCARISGSLVWAERTCRLKVEVLVSDISVVYVLVAAVLACRERNRSVERLFA